MATGRRHRLRAGSESHAPAARSPFVSKAIGHSLAKIAAKVMAGASLKSQGFTEEIVPKYVSVKESVFPFNRFMGVDIVLGPEMRSTGEVMGIDADFALAFAKAQLAAGSKLPMTGKIFISMSASHKQRMIEPARRLKSLGYQLVCTSGTARVFQDAGIEVEVVRKVQEGRPNLLDLMANGEIHLIFNTPSGKGARTDEGKIRAASVTHGFHASPRCRVAQPSLTLWKHSASIRTRVSKQFRIGWPQTGRPDWTASPEAGYRWKSFDRNTVQSLFIVPDK
jgi:hypothetical protein